MEKSGPLSLHTNNMVVSNSPVVTRSSPRKRVVVESVPDDEASMTLPRVPRNQTASGNIKFIIFSLATAEPEERFFIRTYLIAYNTFLASTWANLFSWTALHAYLNRGNLNAIHFFTGKPVALMQIISILEIFHAYFGTAIELSS